MHQGGAGRKKAQHGIACSFPALFPTLPDPGPAVSQAQRAGAGPRSGGRGSPTAPRRVWADLPWERSVPADRRARRRPGYPSNQQLAFGALVPRHSGVIDLPSQVRGEIIVCLLLSPPKFKEKMRFCLLALDHGVFFPAGLISKAPLLPFSCQTSAGSYRWHHDRRPWGWGIGPSAGRRHSSAPGKALRSPRGEISTPLRTET